MNDSNAEAVIDHRSIEGVGEKIEGLLDALAPQVAREGATVETLVIFLGLGPLDAHANGIDLGRRGGFLGFNAPHEFCGDHQSFPADADANSALAVGKALEGTDVSWRDQDGVPGSRPLPIHWLKSPRPSWRRDAFFVLRPLRLFLEALELVPRLGGPLG